MKYGTVSKIYSPQRTVRKSFIGINKTKILRGFLTFGKYFTHKPVLSLSLDGAPSRSDPSAWWR